MSEDTNRAWVRSELVDAEARARSENRYRDAAVMNAAHGYLLHDFGAQLDACAVTKGCTKFKGHDGRCVDADVNPIGGKAKGKRGPDTKPRARRKPEQTSVPGTDVPGPGQAVSGGGLIVPAEGGAK